MRKFSPRKAFPPLRLALSAVASGAILTLAFPPLSLGFLSFVALIPLLIALYRGCHSPAVFYKAGYLFGIAFFLGHLWWIVGLLPSSSITWPWLMTPAVILLALYLSVYPALFFALLRLLGRRGGFSMVLLGPALWYLGELGRSSSELGFSWGAIGYALAPHPALMQSASIVGLFGTGAIVILVNMIWSRVFLVGALRARVAYFVAGGAVLALAAAGGHQAMRHQARALFDGQRRVAVVQPNVDLEVKWDPAFTDSTFRLIRRLSTEAARLKPELIVFPETSAPVYIRHSKPHRDLMFELARELDVAIFIGFLDGRYDGPDEALSIYNSSGVFHPSGGFSQYDKMHLLPFGEAIPFSRKFTSLRKLNFGQANFHPGPERKPLATRVGLLGPTICFESIFPDLSRRLVKDGAEILVNITNDGWFGNTPGPYQHNEMAIFRAVENRRYLLRSSNTGVSMVVDPMGRVVSSLGLNEQGLLVENVRPLQVKTFYTRWGDRPVLYGALLLTVLGALFARISRSTPSDAS